MIQTIKILAISAFSFLLIQSCQDDEATDNTKPTIDIHEPDNGDTLQIGDHVHFDADFTDDTELGSYTIEIHSNEDHHDHQKSGTEHFFYKETWNFDKGLKNIPIDHHEVKIDSLINDEPTEAGDYHFVVYCTDNAGNTTQAVKDIILE